MLITTTHAKLHTWDRTIGFLGPEAVAPVAWTIGPALRAAQRKPEWSLLAAVGGEDQAEGNEDVGAEKLRVELLQTRGLSANNWIAISLTFVIRTCFWLAWWIPSTSELSWREHQRLRSQSYQHSLLSLTFNYTYIYVVIYHLDSFQL